MKGLRFALAVAGAMFVAAPAMAQDDIADKIINAPVPSAYSIYGMTPAPKPRADKTVQGGKALRLAIPGKADQPYAIGLSSAVLKPIKKGDRMVIAFWGRTEVPDEGKTTAKIANVQLQLANPPYTGAFGQEVELTQEWKMYSVEGKADRDYAKGEANVSMHLATGKHVIDLGPIFLIDLGQ